MLVSLEENPTPLLEDVVRPISPESPTGEDITYDDDFQELKSDIDQLSSVNPEGVDYNDLVETCRKLLGEKSKDLRVSVYLGMALFQANGFNGLLEGLVVQKILLEQYWEPLFPPLRRMRARKNALQFLADRLAEKVETTKAKADDREALEASIEVLKVVQSLTMQLMENDAPALSGLRSRLEEALRLAPKPAPPSTPVSPPPVPESTAPVPVAQEASPAAPTPVAAPAFSPPADLSSSEALSTIERVAAYLQEQDPTNPIAYRLARIALFQPIQEDPPNDGGKTYLEDLPSHRLQYLNTLASESNWQELLQTAEETFREVPYHFLLDLQRYVAIAMEGLGSTYKQAREAVLLETALLLNRVPRLAQLSYRGGLPFADAATRFWLEQTVAPVLKAGGEGGSEEGGGDDPLTLQYATAREKLGEGDLGGGLTVLQEGALQDGSPRSRFRRRYYLAYLCLQGNQPALARPILEDLHTEIQHRSLEAWEPALVVDVWTNLYRCYNVLAAAEPEDADIQQRAAAIFERICQIDVTKALSLQKT